MERFLVQLSVSPLVCENYLGAKKINAVEVGRRQGLMAAVESMCSVGIGRVGMDTKPSDNQSRSVSFGGVLRQHGVWLAAA